MESCLPEFLDSPNYGFAFLFSYGRHNGDWLLCVDYIGETTLLEYRSYSFNNVSWAIPVLHYQLKEVEYLMECQLLQDCRLVCVDKPACGLESIGKFIHGA